MNQGLTLDLWSLSLIQPPYQADLKLTVAAATPLPLRDTASTPLPLRAAAGGIYCSSEAFTVHLLFISCSFEKKKKHGDFSAGLIETD